RCRRPCASPPRVDPHRKCSAKPPPRRRLLLPTNHLVNRTVEDGPERTSAYDKDVTSASSFERLRANSHHLDGEYGSFCKQHAANYAKIGNSNASIFLHFADVIRQRCRLFCYWA